MDHVWRAWARRVDRSIAPLSIRVRQDMPESSEFRKNAGVFYVR